MFRLHRKHDIGRFFEEQRNCSEPRRAFSASHRLNLCYTVHGTKGRRP